jgi:hypothetical protein
MSHPFTSSSRPAEHKFFYCCFSHFRAWPGIIRDENRERTSLSEFHDPVVNRFT